MVVELTFKDNLSREGKVKVETKATTLFQLITDRYAIYELIKENKKEDEFLVGIKDKDIKQ